MIALILGLAQGCATTANKPLVAGKMQSATSIEVARYESPCLLKKTAGSQAVAFSGVMFGAIGGALGAVAAHGMEQSGGKSLARECALPDFSRMVLTGFLDRLQNDFPNWPRPDVLDKAIDDEYKPADSKHLIVLRVTQLRVDDSNGLVTVTNGKMLDPAGQVIWEKGYIYKTREFSRHFALKDLEAENGKRLKEEFALAAERTISDFAAHLKGAPSPPKPSQKEPAEASSQGIQEG